MVHPQEVQLKGCMSTRPGGSYSKTAGGKVSQTISSSPGSYTSHHSYFPFTNKNGVSSYQWYEYNPSLHKEEKKDGFRYKLILFEGKTLCFPIISIETKMKDILVKSCCLEYMLCVKNTYCKFSVYCFEKCNKCKINTYIHLFCTVIKCSIFLMTKNYVWKPFPFLLSYASEISNINSNKTMAFYYLRCCIRP